MSARRRRAAALGAAVAVTLVSLAVSTITASADGYSSGAAVGTVVRATSTTPQFNPLNPCDYPFINGVCGAAQDIVSRAATDVTKAVTGWVADGAASLLAGILDVADASFTPNPGAGPVGDDLRRMSGLAAATGVFWLLLVIIQATLQVSMSTLWHGVQRLAFAGLATGGIVWGTQLLLGVADEMTTIVVGGPLSDHARTFIQQLGVSFHSAIDAGAISLFVLAVAAVLTVLVGLALFIELAVRAAAVDLAVLFLPLMLAASVWAPAAGALRKLLTVLVTAIFSKFVIFVTLGLAIDLFSGAVTTPPQGAAGLQLAPAGTGAAAAAVVSPGQTIGYFVVGICLLLLAVAAPVALFSFLSHAPEAVHALAGAGAGRGGATFRQTTSTAWTAARAAATKSLGSATSGSGGPRSGGGGGRSGGPSVLTGRGSTPTPGGPGQNGAGGAGMSPPAPRGGGGGAGSHSANGAGGAARGTRIGLPAGDRGGNPAAESGGRS